MRIKNAKNLSLNFKEQIDFARSLSLYPSKLIPHASSAAVFRQKLLDFTIALVRWPMPCEQTTAAFPICLFFHSLSLFFFLLSLPFSFSLPLSPSLMYRPLDHISSDV